MGDKMLRLTGSNGREVLHFNCPGCGYGHQFIIKAGEPSDPVWTWNGNLEMPTVSPSLLVNQSISERRCHSFVRGGRIEFLSDCYHELAGQTVDLPEID